MRKNGIKISTFNYFLIFAMNILFMGCSSSDKEYPVGINFLENAITRKGNFGDNWCQTWASDGNIYTMMDDGNGWWGNKEKLKIRDDWQGSMCLRIKGGPDFNVQDVEKMSGWPASKLNSPFYAYGILSVDSTLYVWLWKSETDTWYRRPVANRLLYSPDFGKSFYRSDGSLETEQTFSDTSQGSFFFYKEDPQYKIDREAYAFNWIAFCQQGQGHSLARDDFVYMYAPEQFDPRNLSLIRVKKDEILNKSSYEYFKAWDGNHPIWTKQMKERGVNLRYPEKRADGEWLWASWFPSVVYNSGLDLYIMVSYGNSDPGKQYWDGWCNKCLYPASLGFWYAENPWGPWKMFHYTEYFYADRKENRTYGFKLNPKWISEDGKTMQLIWSDAGDNHDTHYKWNQMEIEIILD